MDLIIIRISICITCLFYGFLLCGQELYKNEYVTVSGKKMAYTGFGLENRKEGDPVIVLESGLGMGGGNYAPLFDYLSTKTAWIAYDRNGIAGSEEDTLIRTDTDVVDRLRELLKVLNVAPPYILVGHSLGGPFIRLYVSRYPEEVAGLIFIDPTDFMLTAAEDKLVKANSSSAMGYRKLWTILLERMANEASLPDGVRNEMRREKEASMPEFFKEYTSLPPLPDIPVVVLIAYNRRIEPFEIETSKELDINIRPWFAGLDQFRVIHYSEMIKENNHSKVILLPGYSHGIHNQDPELVATCILEVYQHSLEQQ
ncbi:alpha/beta fold hydrolase [Sinomicrobium pectinilyticum]|nr:alpha/beta hydrolase [Sinomicrobium pectinilyticum]